MLKPNTGGTPQAASAVDQYKMDRLMQEIRDNQNVGSAIMGGAAGAVIGAVLWALITFVTGVQFGLIAVGVGFLVGSLVRAAGKGIDTTFGIIGAVFSLIGCLLGNLGMACAIIADKNGLSITSVLMGLDWNGAVTLIKATFDPRDVLYYGLALYEGYKLSIRRLTSEELTRVAKG